MNKMTLDSVSISSDDDDIPLNVVGATLHVHPTCGSLTAHSLEHCEFCDKVSFNRYEALVHNAKHIIIPLLKQNLHQCTLCLYYFTSRYKLKHHLRNKHKNDVVNKVTNVKVNDKLVNEKSVDGHESKMNEKVVAKHETDDEDDLPLKVTEKLKVRFNIDVTEETEKCAAKCENDAINEAKEKLLKDVKVVLEKFEPIVTNNHSMKIVPDKLDDVSNHNVKVAIQVEPVSNQSLKFVSNDVEPIVKATNHNTNSVPDKPKVNISSRLTFEDDLDICNDEVIKDLTRDCLVDMNLFDEPWLDDLANSITDDDLANLDDDIILIDDDDESQPSDIVQSAATEVTNVQQDMNVEYAPSTHHEELIKPGVYRCKRCPEMFPTKFNQIQHEMQHIRIRKPRPLLCEHCDRFFASKQLLKTHITSKHSTNYRLRTFQICKKCNLKYNNYNRHLEIYHVLLRCHLCNQGFETEVDRLNHIRGHLIKTKCAQCDFIATGIEISEHQKLFHRVSVFTTKTFNLCDVCCLFLKNKNNMQYVFGETISKVGERLYCEHCGNKFFDLTQVKRFGKGKMKEGKDESVVYEKHKKKVLTNTERLKNIQQRLKMINKLSRF